MSIQIGNMVQIRAGGIDVTNGLAATAGKMYGEGGPLWAVVDDVVDGWNTGGKYGLPATVTKVRCSNKGVVVWQVQPSDIVLGGSVSPQVHPPETPVKSVSGTPQPVSPPQPIPPMVKQQYGEKSFYDYDIGSSGKPFAPERDSANWANGVSSTSKNKDKNNSRSGTNTPYISDSMFASRADLQTPSYQKVRVNTDGMPRNVQKHTDKNVRRAQYLTSWQSEGRKREMLNRDAERIQNGQGFPYHVGKGGPMTPDKYDYTITPDQSKYPYISSLENRLMKLRASMGIQVHGNNNIARSVKFYMYNRFKVPDTNLAHNKTFTHIFFTRPDLYIMDGPNKPSKQAKNHTDTALLWRRYPELFKLLVDRTRCGDENNFNMLLSNQVSSFSLQDEQLSVINSSQSWAEHKMAYGEQYTGRTAGEFSCTFTETSEYSVLNLIKLWMTYIDNVSRGAWSPYYGPGNNLNSTFCHVATRTLDYAASVYVFKVGPDGEDVLYWTKYYGVFPISSGASALGWESGSTASMETPRLSINFAYSFKKDMSPISLLEFNHVANVSDSAVWVPAWDSNIKGEKINHTTRPYVGTPYIEISLGTTDMSNNDVRRVNSGTQIRLKYMEDTHEFRSDKILYRANAGNTYSGKSGKKKK